jgi:hypothetical protein
MPLNNTAREMGQEDRHNSEDECNKDPTEPPFEAALGYRFGLRGLGIASCPRSPIDPLPV